MSINIISNFIREFAIKSVGNLLLFLQPKKARQLSENRITLIHKNKNNMSITELLMRGALLRKLEKVQDHHKIAESNRNFWINNNATELFLETEDSFNTHFIPNCSFIFDLMKKEIANQSEEFTTLVEIGTGNGEVLNYLNSKFPKINRFVGVDLSVNQIEINNNKYKDNKRLEFVASDALDWVKSHGQGNTVYVTRDTLEYFLQPQLQEFFNEVRKLGNIIFIAIEPNGRGHNFETQSDSQLYGKEPSFSHNYPYLFKNAGFKVWHFSQKSISDISDTQTFVGVKS